MVRLKTRHPSKEAALLGLSSVGCSGKGPHLALAMGPEGHQGGAEQVSALAQQQLLSKQQSVKSFLETMTTFTDGEFSFVCFAAEAGFWESCTCFPSKVLPGDDQVDGR